MNKWYQLPLAGIQLVQEVGGGDVNQAFKVTAEGQHYFLLVQKGRDASFYDAEALGLKLLNEHGITAPVVIHQGAMEGDAYLLLSYLLEGTHGSQRELGELVAKMHMIHQPDGLFGFDYPYQGKAISFDNSWTDSWSELFIERRMDSLQQAIVERQLWNEEQLAKYLKAREEMVDALAVHTPDPSFLHGDLWAGNYMFLDNGKPALFDPSPMYGDREFDLGATLVFGGFTDDFYAGYEASYPLTAGAYERIQFYRLYLLMVHLLKFGTSYSRSVDQTIQSIIEG